MHALTHILSCPHCLPTDISLVQSVPSISSPTSTFTRKAEILKSGLQKLGGGDVPHLSKHGGDVSPLPPPRVFRPCAEGCMFGGGGVRVSKGSGEVEAVDVPPAV